MPRLKPGQYKNGRLINNPEYEKPEKIVANTEAATGKKLSSKKKQSITTQYAATPSFTSFAPDNRQSSAAYLQAANQPQSMATPGVTAPMPTGVSPETLGLKKPFGSPFYKNEAGEQFMYNRKTGEYTGPITGGAPPAAEFFSPAGLVGVAKYGKSLDEAVEAYKDAPKVGKLAENAKNLNWNTKIGKVVRNVVDKILKSEKTQTITKVDAATGRTIVQEVTTSGNRFNTATITASLFIGALSTYAWNGHLKMDNIMGGYQILMRDLIQAGDLDGAAEVSEAYDDFLNPSLGAKIIDNVPFANIIKTTFFDGVKQAKLTKAVYDDMTAQETANETAGLSDPESWQLYQQQKEESEKRLTDYYNAQKIIAEKALIDARARADKEATDRWYKYQKLLKEQEAENQRLNAEYWLKYLEYKQKYQEDNAFSKLSFGLL